MKKFNWHRVILDKREEGLYQVMNDTLLAHHNDWKGIKVIWTDVKEYDKFQPKDIEQHFEEKKKVLPPPSGKEENKE